jgi:hypothetical protein
MMPCALAPKQDLNGLQVPQADKKIKGKVMDIM